MTRTLVVAGHGMIGHRFADRLRALDTARDWRIVILAEEPHPAYDRLALSTYLGGRSRDDLTLAGRDFLADPRVELRLATPVARADRTVRVVVTQGGDRIRYDALVLATGSRPFVPPVPGRDLTHCFVYRTFEDLDAIRRVARPGGQGLVVGGGLLGLEAAYALSRLGVRPHVVETAPHLMPAQLDPGAAEVLHRRADELGLRLHCGTGVAHVHAGPDGAVRAATLGDGTTLDVDLVVFAAGIRPRDELAKPLDLARGERGGFLVDALCRTADPRVWAIGECAAVLGRCHGLAAPGYAMADSVAAQLTGRDAQPFDRTDDATTLKLLGVHVATFGATVHPGDPRPVEVTFADGIARYAKVFLRPDTGTVLGGILARDTGSTSPLRSLVGRPPPADLERLLLP
ncbi:NAD(P)/FAD-dependent oxidoreductase [Streptomyces rishiriensis]|uniref:NAD(P)/FAD-dependent oxidoreductase n=1 Tax=Streptomyces rishiriensis TaxID=68264 RepID=UPI000D58D562|nr:FAD-dependent oxidoreductase [Streptomyces rishiriensis]